MKIGIDGGGGFLKVSLGVMDLQQLTQQVTIKPLTHLSSNDSSVKRQLLLAICEELPETYPNVKAILELVQVHQISFIMFCDMKLANICGNQSYASSHLFTWCDVDAKNLASCGASRTFGSVKKNYYTFVSSGSDGKKAKRFNNTVDSPIISMPDDSLIIDLISPMELQLLLAVVNHLLQ